MEIHRTSITTSRRYITYSTIVCGLTVYRVDYESVHAWRPSPGSFFYSSLHRYLLFKYRTCSYLLRAMWLGPLSGTGRLNRNGDIFVSMLWSLVASLQLNDHSRLGMVTHASSYTESITLCSTDVHLCTNFDLQQPTDHRYNTWAALSIYMCIR